jgi:hypothetical protein
VNWDFERKNDLDLSIKPIIIDKSLESNAELTGSEGHNFEAAAGPIFL